MLKRLFQMPIHPLLFAIYPVMFFYLNNVQEAYVSQSTTSFVISLGIVTAFFIVYLLVLRSLTRASFMTTLTAIIFFSHGHIQTRIGEITYTVGSWHIGEDKILLGVWTITLLIGLIASFRYPNTISRLTAALNAFAWSLMIFTLVPLLMAFNQGSVVVEQSFDTVDTNKSTVPSSKQSEQVLLPDIYYIILDKYAGNKTLDAYYGFDNSEFTDFLENKGFYISQDSKSNYPRSSYSLASSLNMEYLDTLADEEQVDVIAENAELIVVFPRLQNHKVWNFLESFGYRYYHIGSWFEPTKTNRNATENFVYNQTKLQLDEFTTRFLETTLLKPIASKYMLLDFDTQHRLSIEYAFKKLSELTTKPTPKFVFAHILIPHGPYVLDRNCKNPPIDWGTLTQVEKYNDQLRCANSSLMKIINDILTNSTNPPIIVFQSDEGPNTHVHTMANGDYDFRGVENGAIIERTRIQYALYFPDQQYQRLYQTISPVNTFRLIFSQYFGANFPLYEDRNYVFMGEEDVYNFVFTEVSKDIYK